MNVFQQIAEEVGVPVRLLSAKDITTFKGGGSAYVAIPYDEEAFRRIYRAYEAYGGLIIGGGSNMIIGDGVATVPLISTRGLSKICVKGKSIVAQCGASVRSISEFARRLSLGGFEFLSGVPATLGGAIRMNAGAFGEEMSKFVRSISTLDGNIEEGLKCIFSYRNGVHVPILSAELELREMCSENSVELSKKYLEIRASKQPKFPSCGSVFKNGELPSGKLIEMCGLKGKRVGGAEISKLHANFIVNTGGASATDFMSLVVECERAVKERFGIELEREFVYIS